MVKNPPANAGDTRDMGLISGWEVSLEKEMAAHSSLLAWEVQEEPCGLRSMGSQRVGWATERSTGEKCIPSACQSTSGNPHWQKPTGS